MHGQEKVAVTNLVDIQNEFYPPYNQRSAIMVAGRC
jgi:hypothetical protein